MVSLSTDILQTIDLEKTSVLNLNSQETFDWFGTLPKRCQELFEDAVLISDRRKSVYFCITTSVFRNPRMNSVYVVLTFALSKVLFLHTYYLHYTLMNKNRSVYSFL